MKLALLEVIADLHVNKAYDAATEEFLQSLATAVGQPLQPVSQDQLADTDLPLIFIRSGGTEGLFKALYESLPEALLAANYRAQQLFSCLFRDSYLLAPAR